MGETCECCASDGSSRLTEEVLAPAAATFGVAGVPLDEDILPMYHDCDQNGESDNVNVLSLEYERTGTQPRSPPSSFTAWKRR